jgi:CheY-like chemotaxis protein
VADDEALVRRTAKSALERQGYRVLLAENGREAMDLLRELRRVSFIPLSAAPHSRAANTIQVAGWPPQTA